MKKILNYFAVIISIVVYLLMLFVYQIDINYLKEIKYVYILAIPCFMLLITSFFKEGKDRKRILYLYLIIYLTVLVGFVFSNARVNSALTSGIMHYYWNFIPFKSMIEMLNSPLGVTFGLYNIIGNFLMLTPLSILLPLINKKFKKTKIFLISIVGLTLFIEIVQFFVNVGSFDIDDVILNIGGAFLLYLLIKKTKLKIYLEKFFLTLKINNKRKVLKILLNIFYFLLFIVLFLLSIYNFFNIFYDLSIRKDNIDISNMVCVSDEKVYLLDYDNYHYYSNCNYGNNTILVNDFPYSLIDFIYYGHLDLEYEEKLDLDKEKIITDIKVKVNKDIGKISVNKFPDVNTYWYNIESITITQDGVDYDYREYLRDLEEDKNTVEIDLSPFEETIYMSPDRSYTISRSPYYQELNCIEGGHLSGNPTYSYILPFDYEITSDSCNILNSLDEQ